MYSHENNEAGSTESFAYSGKLHGVFVAFTGFIFTVVMQVRGMLPRSLFVTVAGTIAGYFIGKTIARSLFGTGARVANAIYTPSGQSTAYVPTFSHIEALEIRGDLDGASAAWDSAILEQPESAITRVRAADFQLRLRKDAARALELYTQARALDAGTVDLKRYIQQKIVDLYLGPLNDEGRALVELRRLIDAFPDSREAEGAREALAEIKARRATS